MKTHRTLIFSLLFIFVSACGGGGGDTEKVSPEPENVEQTETPSNRGNIGPTCADDPCRCGNCPVQDTQPDPVQTHVPSGNVIGSYNFLVSWAGTEYRNKEITCNDPVLTRKAPLPVPFLGYHKKWHARRGPMCNATTNRAGVWYPENLGEHRAGFEAWRKSTLNGDIVFMTAEYNVNSISFPEYMNVARGHLYGKWNHNGYEYRERKDIVENCNPDSIREYYNNFYAHVTDPDYFDRSSAGHFTGTWTKTRSLDGRVIELCIRLDDVPGAVKCYRETVTGELDADNRVIKERAIYRYKNGTYTLVTKNGDGEWTAGRTGASVGAGLTLFPGGTVSVQNVCEIFDEG